MSRYDAVIFDFNGVLWWDTQLQEQSWRDFSTAIRGTPLTDDEMKQHMHGRPNAYVLEYLRGCPLDADTVADLTRQKEALYQQLCLRQRENFRLSPGAIELLDFLAARTIPHTIATASEIGNVRFFFQHLHLAAWFDMDAIVYDDGTFPGKPAPDIYQIAAGKIGVSPERCIVCEDSLSGIAAARAAGIGKIVALSTSSPPEILWQQPGVSAVISNFCAFDRDWLRTPEDAAVDSNNPEGSN